MNVTKEQFFAYENVRLSGATNMFDIRKVQELSGLESEVILSIMKHYSRLAKKYRNA
jgi:hypothetical protein